jgi:hypothetical protein
MIYNREIFSPRRMFGCLTNDKHVRVEQQTRVSHMTEEQSAALNGAFLHHTTAHTRVRPTD